MQFSRLYGVLALLCSTAVHQCAAISVGFAEEDQSYREGRDRDDLFLQKEETTEDVMVRIRLLSVAEFRTYVNTSGRVFTPEILNRVDQIDVPAESGADFNNMPIQFVFGAAEVETRIELNGSIIIDDVINEATEGFVMVLETNGSANEFLDGRDVLRFNIFDNDDITIGFDRIVVNVNEDAGNLTDILVLLSNGISQQNITFNVTISSTGSSSSATPDVDFRPVDGLYSYTLTLPAGQTSIPLNPIGIIDDLLVEGDEMFYIMLTAGGEVPITPGRSMANIFIIDNDFPPSPSPPPPPPSSSMQPPPTPPPRMDMGGDPHYSIMLPTGQLLCFSVHGEKNFPFNLISNSLLQMNAFFIEDARREEITWIGSLGVVVQHSSYKKSNTTKIRFEAKDQMIYINNGVTLHAKRVERLTLANGKLTVTEAVRKDAVKNAEVEVDLVDVGLSFSVRFVKKRHLDMSWRKVSEQPTDSHGIIGQFLREGVRIHEVNKLLYLPTMKPVPVMRSSVWHFMERESPDQDQPFCWQAMNPGYQGKRLIEGSYLDYLVDDVLSSDFKFKTV